MAIFWELFDQNYVVKSLILLARSEGFEPPTLGIEIRCSIQLSYERIFKYLIEFTYL